MPAARDIKEAMDIADMSLKRAINVLSQQALQLDQEIRLPQTEQALQMRESTQPEARNINLGQAQLIPTPGAQEIKGTDIGKIRMRRTSNRVKKIEKKIHFDSGTEDDDTGSDYFCDIE